MSTLAEEKNVQPAALTAWYETVAAKPERKPDSSDNYTNNSDSFHDWMGSSIPPAGQSAATARTGTHGGTTVSGQCAELGRAEIARSVKCSL